MWLLDLEIPNEAFFPLSNSRYDHCKNVYYPFSWKQLSEKRILSSKPCSVLVKTITEKMQSSK